MLLQMPSVAVETELSHFLQLPFCTTPFCTPSFQKLAHLQHLISTTPSLQQLEFTTPFLQPPSVKPTFLHHNVRKKGAFLLLDVLP